MASDSEDKAAPPNATNPELTRDDDYQRDTEAQSNAETEADGAEEEEEEEAISEDEDEEEDDEEEEPKLKYARLTSQLGPLYRNGDATSAFVVAGDKMFVGTHNGNIHVISLPAFQPLRPYKAHSASITSISISPYPPPSIIVRQDGSSRAVSQAHTSSPRPPSIASTSTPAPRSVPSDALPNTPSNALYIATSSIDGNVCVASLLDRKDVQLRNFARPVQAVALSPDYKNDRTYLSGGLAGNLVLTVGGRAGTSSTSTTTGTAAATASGWLGSMGLGGSHAKDTVLHYGEGTISSIKWSLSGKYVVWVNEHGVKIMRSNLHLDSADSDFAWKRIAHVDRPQEEGWEEMAGVWKARLEWIDEKLLGSDEDSKQDTLLSPASAKLQKQAAKSNGQIEKLLVGWGGTIWIINVHPGGVGVGKDVGEKTAGRAEIIKILKLDCIVSGLSLYTPTLLLALCYVTPDEEEEEEPEIQKGHKSKLSTASTGSEPQGGIRRRQNALPPELRLIDLGSSEEVEVDTDDLTVSRYERLSAADYHLGVLPAVRIPQSSQTSRGTLEVLSGMGSGMWSATLNATSLLSSATSVRSFGSKSDGDSGTGIMTSSNKRGPPVHPMAQAQGMKIFIHSPYDCILAVKRDLQDHLSWILDQHKYEQAWELVNEHPEVISSSPERLAEIGPDLSIKRKSSIEDFYDESSTIRSSDSPNRLINSAVEKEKRRIGELWIQQLIEAGDWTAAGRVCGKVLGTSTRWEHWVWTFAGANKFDEITPYLPTLLVHPPLPSTIYEVALGHYIAHNRLRLRELLDRWSVELFNVETVATALENQLKYRDVREDSVEDGEVGRDWRIVQESLGKLYVADGRPREALKCYFRLQDADAAMSLIKDFHLVDAVVDDIPGLILLRVSKEQLKNASRDELEDASSEAITLLVREAHHGLVRPEEVVKQLQEKKLPLFLFFYIRSLWVGEGIDQSTEKYADKLISDSKSLVDEFADLAVELFATYDRDLLMDFLKSSTYYAFEKASQVCEDCEYIPELVYLYSKTGQMKRALFLIIDKLADVSQAISFTKQQDDPDLWEDLLNYSMDKPRFIRGLLEEVGTSIDPIRLVRRIPEGLAIEGLREGLSRMIKEYEIQHSISSGVAAVLRGEVAAAQHTLRVGQRRGIRFEIHHPEELDDSGSSIKTAVEPPVPAAASVDDKTEANAGSTVPQAQDNSQDGDLSAPKPGYCAGCHQPFFVGDYENEMETLVGFACGHVFHLTHLLERLYPDRPVSPDVGVRDYDAERFMTTHSVGAKVTHARLLRDRIQGGCPFCTQKNSAAAMAITL